MTRSVQRFHADAAAVAESIIREVGGKIVLGLPLGLGKANHVVNALYARAAADPTISLRIFTALSLSRPVPGTELARRFLAPVFDRAFHGYPELAYVEPLRQGRLPRNVEVNEFFLQAGAGLASPAVQQSYISANYTHATGYLLDRGVNVVAQLVAKGQRGRELYYSLSCNTDITLELLAARRAGRAHFLLVGQVNAELPYMLGEAEIESSEFSDMLEGPAVEFPLPSVPRPPVSLVEQAIGLHVASLVPDGGTLQLGIGSLGDAVAHGLILRHREPQHFARLLTRLAQPNDRLPRFTEPFQAGLYAATEMFVDAFLDLYRAGVLIREVDGAVLHGAFFLGPRAFYRALRELPQEELGKFQMTSVSFVNDLYGEDAGARRRARVNARFVNNAMIVTLLGAVTSDGLEDGRVVSGVGGQYNMVAQAFALEGARSVMALPSTYEGDGRISSNIRWTYGHTTIPRHLRDLVVTEYGVADLRGRTDADVIAALLSVTDSRFQRDLLARARDAGKIDRDYQIPAYCRENTPERVSAALASAREAGLLPIFPFGSEFTKIEQRLMPALEILKSAAASRSKTAKLLMRGLLASRQSETSDEGIRRLGLDQPRTLKELVYAALVRGAFAQLSDQRAAASAGRAE